MKKPRCKKCGRHFKNASLARKCAETCGQKKERNLPAVAGGKKAMLNNLSTEETRPTDLDDRTQPKVKECTYHADGKHRFIPCDEWPATCWCGKQENES